LDRETLKSFFAVSGEPGSFTLNRGHERIPTNWYRRPSTSAHTIPEVFVDLASNNLAYPGIVRFGGNTGKTVSEKRWGVSLCSYNMLIYHLHRTLLLGWTPVT
jgi:hypothetical protein